MTFFAFAFIIYGNENTQSVPSIAGEGKGPPLLQQTSEPVEQPRDGGGLPRQPDGPECHPAQHHAGPVHAGRRRGQYQQPNLHCKCERLIFMGLLFINKKRLLRVSMSKLV